MGVDDTVAKEDILLELIQYDKKTMNSILGSAVNDYAAILTEIAKDIYDSCIKQFYDSYTPKIYNRHGDITGFNLYSANSIGYSNLIIDLSFEPENLLPYYKMKKVLEDEYDMDEFDTTDKRTEVLTSVMTGIRARKSPRTPPWFPMTWRASYPNSHSRYSEWSSGCKTMNAIFDDFCVNVVNDTSYIFWNLLSRYV